jgi:type VI secretion system protein VasD
MKKSALSIALQMGLAAGLAVLLGGCAAGAPLLGSAASLAMQSLGIGKPDLPDSQKPPRDMPLRLYAANNLNAALDHHAFSLVVRIYVLKDATAFQQAPFDTFSDPAREKAVLGTDLLQVREVTLVPGQIYDVTEKVAYEATAVGIVSLFRAPAPQRWKFAFDPVKSGKSGVTVGLHNCAMTVTSGTVIPTPGGRPPEKLNMLSDTSCG